MGGVDKLDQLISCYRIHIKSKKWTLRMLFHAIDLSAVNSWLEYQKTSAALGVSKKKILDLLHFKMRLASDLCTVGLAKNRQKGRPLSSPIVQNKKICQRVVEVRPHPEIVNDCIDHMPKFDDKREATRCKNYGCSGKTHIYCIKCAVHLCFTRGRNCFFNFHVKK